MTQPVILTAEQKLSRAKVRLLRDSVFFYHMVARLEFEEADHVPTAATDGSNLYWNRAFIDKLPVWQVIGLLIHEALHVALKHIFRRGDRQFRPWNIACDFAINQYMEGVIADYSKGGKTFFSLPEGGLLDKRYAGWHAEKIYDSFPVVDGIVISPKGIEPFGEVWDAADIDGKVLTGVDAANMEKELEIAASMAAEQEKKIGTLPSSLLKLLKEAEVSQINWIERVRSILSGQSITDYSWRKLNRRMMGAHGIYMPGIVRSGAALIVIGVDASGSVSVKEQKHFLGEMQAICEDLKPDKIIVLSCDTRVAQADEYEPGDEIAGVINTGGGTAFAPVFEWIEKMELVPDAVIYLTDGHGYPPKEAPDYQTIWVTTQTDTNFKWGDVVHLRMR